MVLSAINESDQLVFSVGLEGSPVFNYGNVKALTLFGCDLPDLIQLVALDTVPEAGQSAEQLAVSTATSEGSLTYYQSQRISRKGKLWNLSDGKVWLLKDSLNRHHGIGYCFGDWQLET